MLGISFNICSLRKIKRRLKLLLFIFFIRTTPGASFSRSRNGRRSTNWDRKLEGRHSIIKKTIGRKGFINTVFWKNKTKNDQPFCFCIELSFMHREGADLHHLHHNDIFKATLQSPAGSPIQHVQCQCLSPKTHDLHHSATGLIGGKVHTSCLSLYLIAKWNQELGSILEPWWKCFQMRKDCVTQCSSCTERTQGAISSWWETSDHYPQVKS